MYKRMLITSLLAGSQRLKTLTGFQVKPMYILTVADFLQISENCRLLSVCRTDITFVKVIILKMLFLFYRLFFIKKIALFGQNFPQLPMCLFSRSSHTM